MPTSDNAATHFEQIMADEWEARLQHDPTFATMTGDHRYGDRLPDLSEAGMAVRLGQVQALQARLAAVDCSALPAADQLNDDMLGELLDRECAELGFHAYRLPICKTGGFHMSFTELPLITPLDSVADYERYIARLRAWPRLAADLIEVMRAGLRHGQTPPRCTLDGVAQQLGAQVVAAPQQSPLYQPLQRFPSTFSDAQQQRLLSEGQAAIMGAVAPGYQALQRFLLDEYLPAAREDVAAANLPDGRAFYAHRIRAFTSLDLTAEEVHATGLAEVARLRGEMAEVIRRVGFAGSFADFVAFLRSDPRFYVDSPGALLKEASYIVKRMEGELPRLFRTLPRMPYGVQPVPDDLAPGNTTAYYFPPSGDGAHAGVYFVNTYDLKSRPLYELEALSLHEAVPGHHLQIALQQELTGLPPFRRFADFTAFIEGWALYAERLGLEVGFYQDAYSDFGRLSFAIWRACRLVVDTGMHALGWTWQQAIDYMAANSALTMLNITNEVDRYIAWPGQALAYAIGELTIRRLRRQAEQALGERFSLRDFHEVVLGSGAVPLRVLEQQVEGWIARGGAVM